MTNILNVIDINDRSPYYNISVYNRYSFRTNKFHKRVKHCYEATFLSGTLYFHVGFSNSNSSRTFFSYWRNGPRFFYHYSGDVSEIIDLEVNQKQSILVCYDSIKSKFSMIFGDRIVEREIPIFKRFKTWYPFLDAGHGVTSSNPSYLSVNFGYSQFVNTVPNDYIPWIYNLLGEDCSHYNVKRSYYISILLITLIIKQ